MLQARHPDIACRSAADFRTIEGIAAWIERHFD
jgi:[acyl-carrier-protein] S-malonyltransferase